MRDAAADRVADAADEPAPVPDAPATLAAALAELRARGYVGAADAIARRVAQAAPKMRLTEDQGLRAALALLAIADRDTVRALHEVMPRSTVELARATAERGVPLDELDAIASYLVSVTRTLDFGRLGVFDENHSHVTGREWHEIDYTGEGMTWQGQRDYWRPRGVTNFKRATYIHAYFVGAERLPHWRRVYRPRGRMVDVAAP